MKIVYECDDGMQFYSEDAAKEHEKEMGDLENLKGYRLTVRATGFAYVDAYDMECAKDVFDFQIGDNGIDSIDNCIDDWEEYEIIEVKECDI